MVMRGETQLSAGRNVFTGGKGLNQSVALAKAGLDVYHAGCIGKEGGFLLDALKDAGVHTDYVKVLTDTPSGHTVIQNDKNGDNCILLFGGANRAITEAQIDETLSHFEKGDFLVMQNEINNLGYLIDRAHERGMKLVLNPSPMEDYLLGLHLQFIDYFFMNEIEASQQTGADAGDPEALIKGIRERFPRASVVLTLGEKGSYYIHGEELVQQDIYHVKPVDTTAAGDTFSGYFLSGIVSGMRPKEALDLASRASAIAITRQGAAPSIPSREEVEQFTFS
jgi:ribokinase